MQLICYTDLRPNIFISDWFVVQKQRYVKIHRWQLESGVQFSILNFFIYVYICSLWTLLDVNAVNKG